MKGIESTYDNLAYVKFTRTLHIVYTSDIIGNNGLRIQ